MLLPITALLAAAYTPPLSRRALLRDSVACAVALGGGRGAALATPGEDAAARNRAQLADPFGASRANGERSSSYADELPPLSLEERRAKQQAAAARQMSSDPRDISQRPDVKVSKRFNAPSAGDAPTANDEFTLEFNTSQPLGLKLKDLRVGFEYGTTEGTSRVLVSDVSAGGQAAALGRVEIDNIVVAVDGANVERSSAKDVTNLLAKAKKEGRPVAVTFKDSLKFNEVQRRGSNSRAAASTRLPLTRVSSTLIAAVHRDGLLQH